MRSLDVYVKLVESGVIPTILHPSVALFDAAQERSGESSVCETFEPECKGHEIPVTVEGSAPSQMPFRIPNPPRRCIKSSVGQTKLASGKEQANQLREKLFPTTGERWLLSLADLGKTLDKQYAFGDIVEWVLDVEIYTAQSQSTVEAKLPEQVIPSSESVQFMLDQGEVISLRDLVLKLAPECAYEESYDGHVVQVGDGKGLLSVAQLGISFYVMLDEVHKVIQATEWLKTMKSVSFRPKDPFDDIGKDFIESVITCVQMLPLRDVKTGTGMTKGINLLNFVREEWLNSTCVIAALEAMHGRYDGVGFVTPEFVGMADPERRKITVAAHGAFDDSNKAIAGIINWTNIHWVAFYLDRALNVCHVCDPLQNKNAILKVQGIASKDIPFILSLKVRYETFTDISQPDGHSCGVLSLMFIELMIKRKSWEKSYVNHLNLFRARYLRMASCLVRG